MRKIILIIFILFLSGQKASATTTIRMIPPIIYTQLGGSFSIDVVVENITDLLAGKIELGYDETKINAQTITTGNGFLEKNGGDALFLTKKINDVNGSITVEFAIFGGSPTGVSGTGTIFSVSFKSIHATPTTQISFNLVDLRNTENIPIPVENQFPAQVSLSPPFHHYQLSSPTSIIAGIPFNLIISAENINKQIVTSYKGTATLSVDKGTITPTQVTNFVEGVATVSLTFYTAETITITAKDLEEPAKLGTISLVVLPGTLSEVMIIPDESPPLIPATTFQFNAKTYDEFKNEILGCTFLWAVVAKGGTISTTGLFTVGTCAGIYPNTIKVEVTHRTITKTDFATVTITPGSLDKVIINPQNVILIPNQTFQFTAKGVDVFGNEITGLLFSWDVVTGGGTISPTGLFTAGTQAGIYPKTVKVTTLQNGIVRSDYATVTITSAELDHFDHFIFDPIDDQRINEPFSIKITALDEFGCVITHFQGTVTLSDTTKTIFPTDTGSFTNGVWIGSVTIKKLGLEVKITAQKDGIVNSSDAFSVLVPKDKKYFYEEDNILVEIGAHSLLNDYILEIDQFSAQDNLAISLANDKFNRDPKLFQQIDKSVHKFTSCNTKGILDLVKGAQTKITFSYNNTDLGQIDETKLKVYRLDSEKREWIEMPCQVYSSVNKVTASISQLGIYILAGPIIATNFNNFVVFPNPFKIDRDGSIIEFAGLPENVTIKIYDISGNLVKYVEHQTASWQWNVANEIDSGIYIYVITDKDGKKIIGKIGVIR